MWRINRGRRRPPIKTSCYQYFNFRVSVYCIMLLFIYSESMPRSVVVVHFAIVLNKVVSIGIIPHLRDILYVYSTFR